MVKTYLEIWCEICHACSKPAIWKGAHWCWCRPCTCMLMKILDYDIIWYTLIFSFIYSRLSLTRSPRDSLKNFEISISRHIWDKKSQLRPRWLSWMRRPTGDREVAGSTPAEVGNFFCGDGSCNIFCSHSLPSADLRRAVVSFWQKNVHNAG